MINKYTFTENSCLVVEWTVERKAYSQLLYAIVKRLWTTDIKHFNICIVD